MLFGVPALVLVRILIVALILVFACGGSLYVRSVLTTLLVVPVVLCHFFYSFYII